MCAVRVCVCVYVRACDVCVRCRCAHLRMLVHGYARAFMHHCSDRISSTLADSRPLRVSERESRVCDINSGLHENSETEGPAAHEQKEEGGLLRVSG